MSVLEKIQSEIEKNKVILFMKGTPQFPQCGFSAKAIKLLQSSGIQEFATVNVLNDPEIRQGIKDFSNWPTIPQLYVKGEFIGGCDIMTEMFDAGELQELIKSL
ncbi:MAG TPA: Grx4 family monothiol glutaredoxin [Gammaproteobacteria bacterium]|jgi:monothiol glutaredoxin|nr:Grx4 family monothiol glutaredoxin [Gammaproteobacteria bacterium]